MKPNTPIRSLRYVALLLTFLLYGESMAEITAINALKIVGTQRVLSLSMLKNYCQIGQEIRFLSAQDELKQSIKTMDSGLVSLKTYAGDQNYSTALAGLEAAWKPFKAALAKPPAKDAAAQVETLADALHDSADHLILTIEDSVNLPQEHIFNLVNQQTTLTQRTAAQYLLTSWGIDVEANRQRFKEAVAEFDSNLIALSTAPENNQKTTNTINSITKRWELFKIGHHVDEGEYVSDFVVRICDSARDMLMDATDDYLNSAIPEG